MVSLLYSSEAKEEALVAEPGHRGRFVGEACFHQVGVVGPLVKCHDDFVGFDSDRGRDVNQVAKELLGLRLFAEPDRPGVGLDCGLRRNERERASGPVLV